jgi:hypothetical protein
MDKEFVASLKRSDVLLKEHTGITASAFHINKVTWDSFDKETQEAIKEFTTVVVKE